MVYKYKAIKVNGIKHDEHRYLMEQKIRRKLDYNELVHHKDGNPRNNDLKNLEVVQRSEHTRNFMKGKKYNTHRYKNGKYWCSNCKGYLFKDKFWPDKDDKNGIRTYCKICELKKMKERNTNITKR